MAAMDEFALIERLLAPLAHHPGARRLADDGARLPPPAPGMELAVTKDMMAEGVHFLPGDPPDLVARKLLRCNLSDLAAMGASPVGYLLGLASDGTRGEAWLQGFAAGLEQDQRQYRIALLGGDTIAVAAGRLTLSLTAFGEAPCGRALVRDGARVGDLVAVSGSIGDGALGLMARRGELGELSGDDRQSLAWRYLLPQPRLALGRALRACAHAALDVSDGLLADAGQLARRSGLALALRPAAFPLSAPARRALAPAPQLLAMALTGGDDYELLFTFPPQARAAVTAAARRSATAVTVIGVCREGEGVTLEGPGSDALARMVAAGASGGWRHRL